MSTLNLILAMSTIMVLIPGSLMLREYLQKCQRRINYEAYKTGKTPFKSTGRRRLKMHFIRAFRYWHGYFYATNAAGEATRVTVFVLAFCMISIIQNFKQVKP